MNVYELVEQALRAGGFDGLWNENGECACKVDDLAPCGSPSFDCRPGYARPCDCGEHDFHIADERPAPSCEREPSA